MAEILAGYGRAGDNWWATILGAILLKDETHERLEHDEVGCESGDEEKLDRDERVENSTAFDILMAGRGGSHRFVVVLVPFGTAAGSV